MHPLDIKNDSNILKAASMYPTIAWTTATTILGGTLSAEGNSPVCCEGVRLWYHISLPVMHACGERLAPGRQW